MLDLFDHTVAGHGDAVALDYFERLVTWHELDAMSDRAAAGLAQAGVKPGDRVALFMQNVPQYVVSVLAAWKLGAIGVAINPMLVAKDVAFILEDSSPAVLVGLDELIAPLLASISGRGSPLPTIVATSAAEMAVSWPDELGTAAAVEVPGSIRWRELVATSRIVPQRPNLGDDDPAMLTYTSGTTGPPKGAINTHGNLMFASLLYEGLTDVNADDVVLGVAPLFHITGLTAHVGLSVATGARLVVASRFDLAVLGRAIQRTRPTVTVGAITVFIAMLGSTLIPRDDFSLRIIYSGGAPIAPATVAAFEREFGVYIHNVYGLTETSGPCAAVPLNGLAPVDPTSGALAAGRATMSTEIRVVDEQGRPLPPGTPGELTVRGPQVVPGYWRREAESANAIREGWLFTGDVAVIDDEGWVYIVDRLKDQINASGFKVWPREVEDTLMGHPAVVEAAVVGVPDEYRGETVKAFVVLNASAIVEPEELIEFSRGRLAAYKYPRQIEIVAELPKTASGKIMRRELR